MFVCFLPLADVPCAFCPCQRLVVKPDQLIKRRGKLGLVGIDLDLPGVRDWLRSRLMKETTVSRGFRICQSKPSMNNDIRTGLIQGDVVALLFFFLPFVFFTSLYFYLTG